MIAHRTSDRTRHVRATATVTIRMRSRGGGGPRDFIEQRLFDAANAVFGAAELLQRAEHEALGVGARMGGRVLQLGMLLMLGILLGILLGLLLGLLMLMERLLGMLGMLVVR